MLTLAQTADQAGAVTDAHLKVAGVDLIYETSRGPLTALEGLSFQIQAGEFVCVVGPSGCGKSSLLKLVSGLLPPSGGELLLGGQPVRKPRPDVGIVFQQATLLPWKTVYENVMVPVRALGRRAQDYRDKAEELLRLVGLSDFRSHYPRELSGGMQQRVAVARGLVHDPALLLMDEPFAALDAMTRESMMAELQRIWMSTGKSVLFITHSIPEAVFLADRIIVMSPRPGRVLEEIVVDIPRPRTVKTLGEPRFVSIGNHLRQMFFEMTGGDR
jgi:NitT/TauT family transport system ATP-binding protein